MESMEMTVLETYDSTFCCVCSQNAGNFYLNIFKNVIVYRQDYISLAQIINETLSYNVQQSSSADQLQDICINCKNKIVDFYIFKRRNEEARAIFTDSSALGPPVRSMLLKVVDEMENSLAVSEKCPDEGDDEEEVAEFPDNDLDADNQLMEEEFLDSSEVDAVETYEEVNVDESQDTSQDIKGEPTDTSEEPGDGCQDNSYDQYEMIEEKNEPTVVESPTSSIRKKSARERHPETWIRNKRKLAKNKGQSYVSSNGKMIEAKQMRVNCGPSCRMQCFQKMTEENRVENFQHFYQLADIAKQRKFLFDHMKTYVPKRTKTPMNPNKFRAVQRCYFLDLVRSDGEKEPLQVCKLMFLNTFSISSQMIDTLHRKASSEGEFSDTRGKFERKHSKPLEFCVQHIKDHRKNDKNIPVTKLHAKSIEVDCPQIEVDPLNDESSCHRAANFKIPSLKRRKLLLEEVNETS